MTVFSWASSRVRFVVRSAACVLGRLDGGLRSVDALLGGRHAQPQAGERIDGLLVSGHLWQPGTFVGDDIERGVEVLEREKG